METVGKYYTYILYTCFTPQHECKFNLTSDRQIFRCKDV